MRDDWRPEEERMTCYLEIDIAALIGTCESERESFLPLDGASNGRFLFAEGCPNQLTTTVQGLDHDRLF